MLAAAQHATVDELRPAKRQRHRQLGLRQYTGPPGGHVLLGVRISVYWPDDDAFYKVGLSSWSTLICTSGNLPLIALACLDHHKAIALTSEL